MKKNYVEWYIPIAATTDAKTQAWYLDIRNLSLSQLISLRKELTGYARSVAALDTYIHREANDVDIFKQSTIKETYKSYNAFFRVRRRRGK